jgi:hypothetical protein
MNLLFSTHKMASARIEARRAQLVVQIATIEFDLAFLGSELTGTPEQFAKLAGIRERMQEFQVESEAFEKDAHEFYEGLTRIGHAQKAAVKPLPNIPRARRKGRSKVVSLDPLASLLS